MLRLNAVPLLSKGIVADIMAISHAHVLDMGWINVSLVCSLVLNEGRLGFNLRVSGLRLVLFVTVLHAPQELLSSLKEVPWKTGSALFVIASLHHLTVACHVAFRNVVSEE